MARRPADHALTISTRLGGHQIEYEHQDPVVHRMFLESAAKAGFDVRMDGFPVAVE